jgi:hypothetical protein
LKAIVGMQQSLVLWRTNNPWNIFISIIGTPVHISNLNANNGVKKGRFREKIEIHFKG